MKPTRSAGFSRSKKIPYQAPLTQLGPKNVYFGKSHFWDPYINVRSFIFFGKFKELPGATLFCFAFSTTVPKKTPKNDQNHFPTS